MPFYGQTPDYLHSYPPFSMATSFEEMEKAIPETSKTKLRLADLMAGTGKVGRAVSALLWRNRGIAANVLYVDGNKDMLRDPAYTTKDRRLQSDIRSIRLPDQCADVVTIRAGLNNLAEEDWHGALKEILRITRNTGAIVLQDHFPLTEVQRIEMDAIEHLVALREQRPVMPGLWTLKEVKEVIDARGWTVTREKTFHHAFSLQERMKAKGISMDCVTDAQIVYPISTLTLQKGA